MTTVTNERTVKKSDELKAQWGFERYAQALSVVFNRVTARRDGWSGWTEDELRELYNESADTFDLFDVLLGEIIN